MRWRLALGSAALSTLAVLSLPGVAVAAVTLNNYEPVVGATPTTPQEYHVTTTTNFWSVVAVRPPAGADYDLKLSAGSQSRRSGSVIDFVAVNSYKCRPLGQFVATVSRYDGTGDYTVEVAQGTDTLGTEVLPFPSTNSKIASVFGPGIATKEHFVAVRDVFLFGGRTTELYAAHVGGVPGEVFVMASDPADASTCIRSRAQALASKSINQNGSASGLLTFTPPRTGWYGLVQVSYGPDPQIGYSSLRIGQAAA